jgi:hypothetical protein
MAFNTRQDMLDAVTAQGGIHLSDEPQVVRVFTVTINGSPITISVMRQHTIEVHNSIAHTRSFDFYELANGQCYWMNRPYEKILTQDTGIPLV